MTTAPLTASTIMDGKLRPLQMLALLLCFLVVAADGFDVASIGYVAPLLKKEWGLSAAQLGPMLAAGLVGLMFGSFIFGPLSDKIGRKRVTIISMLVFGLGSLACAYATSPAMLIALRFITGLGLGGALPNSITISTEFSPTRIRAFLVTLMLTGFTIGLAGGGALAAILIPQFGWQGVFIFGGVFPLCLLPIILVWMPESLRFMAGKPQYAAQIREVVTRLTGDNTTPIDGIVNDTGASNTAAKSAINILFSPTYRIATLLFWLTFFCILWVYYQLTNWLPTIMTEAGIDISRAALIGAMLPLGGAVGALLNGFLMDRFNPFLVLTASLTLAAISVALIGYTIHMPALIFVDTFMAGIGLTGGQAGLTVLVAGFYTTAARATGVSWALAVGRIGSIIGTLTGGVLFAALGSAELAFVCFAVPIVVAGAALLINGKLHYGKILAD